MKFSANKEWSNLVVVVIPGRFCKTFFMFKLINWALETRSQLNRIWVSNCTYILNLTYIEKIISWFDRILTKIGSRVAKIGSRLRTIESIPYYAPLTIRVARFLYQTGKIYTKLQQNRPKGGKIRRKHLKVPKWP
jgi:hypothetical protein